jgi:hypothetical protein
MNKPEIELKRERDFSGVFNVSFSFMSQEIKRLLRVIALYAGVPVVIAVIMNTYYAQDTFSSIMQIVNGTSTYEGPNSLLIFLTSLLGFLAHIFIAGLVPAYMAEYEVKGKGGFTAADVWNRFMKHFGAIIGYSILATIMLIVGIVFLIIPGIYLSVPFAFILYVKIIEDRDFSGTLSRCFQLVRNNWWATMGIIILAYLIVGVVGGLFSIPAMIVAAINGFLIGTGQQETFQSDSLAFVVSTIFGGLGRYILYPVLYIIIAFQYYSLREQKDRDTLMDKVSSINEQE